MSTNTHEATDSYLGYVFQGYFALVVLLDAGDGEAVSIETSDDVTLEGSRPTLFQIKHSIGSKRPALREKDVGFWKALGIWQDQLCTNMAHHFVFVTTAILPGDSILAPLGTAASARASVVEGLKAEAERVSRRVDAARALGKPEPHKDRYQACAGFLALTSKQKTKLIDSITVLDESFTIDDIYKEVEKRLNRVTEASKRTPLYTRLVEWWDRQVTLSLVGRRSRVIAKDELLRQISHLQVELSEDSLPDDFSLVKPDPEEVTTLLGSTMERQIDLVSGGPERVARAAIARWQAREQRQRWMADDLANAVDLKGYDERLVEEWSYRHGPMSHDSSALDEAARSKAGRDLLDWTHSGAPSEIQPPVRGWTAPFLIRGTYQQLSEEERVGWHPQFRDLLAKRGKIDDN